MRHFEGEAVYRYPATILGVTLTMMLGMGRTVADEGAEKRTDGPAAPAPVFGAESDGKEQSVAPDNDGHGQTPDVSSDDASINREAKESPAEGVDTRQDHSDGSATPAPALAEPSSCPTSVKSSGLQENAASKNPKTKSSASSIPASTNQKREKMFTVGFGLPLFGFAYEGIIEGSGSANTSDTFLWGNLDLRFHVRLSRRFSIGGGLVQSFIYFDEVGLIGGHLAADFRWYAVPDYLYFKVDLFFGFPMFFAVGPAVGHSIPITKKVHVFIENQFLTMAVAGLYGFWQPVLGVSTRF
jgi:hypothetical protein